MNSPNLLSRRTVLKGSAAAVALAGIVAPAAAAETSEVHVAIVAHRVAWAALQDAIDHHDAVEQSLEALPNYDWRPGVQYGFRLVDVDERRPLLAYSHAELDMLCEREQAPAGTIWGDQGRERVAARYTLKHAELKTKLRRKARLERRFGLPAATKALAQAYEAEGNAAVALLLARPETREDQAAKRGYMRGKTSFKASWWDGEHMFRAIQTHMAGFAP